MLATRFVAQAMTRMSSEPHEGVTDGGSGLALVLWTLVGDSGALPVLNVPAVSLCVLCADRLAVLVAIATVAPSEPLQSR